MRAGPGLETGTHVPTSVWREPARRLFATVNFKSKVEPRVRMPRRTSVLGFEVGLLGARAGFSRPFMAGIDEADGRL